MSTITDVSPQVKDKNRCNIYLDGSFYCGMKLETAVKHRLKVGLEIEKDRLDEIQLENEQSEATDKALTFITARMKTGKEVFDYLKKKGYVPAVCEFVVEKLKGYGYIDDEEYSRQFVSSASKNKGRRLIALELKNRGVSEDCIENSLDNLSSEEAAFSVLSKYMKNKEFTRENLHKAFRYLMSKGFDYDEAKSALEKLGTDLGEE